MDALHAEGLDLDLVDQMKDLSVVGDDADDVKESQADVLAAFSRSAPSTKVLSASFLWLSQVYAFRHHDHHHHHHHNFWCGLNNVNYCKVHKDAEIVVGYVSQI